MRALATVLILIFAVPALADEQPPITLDSAPPVVVKTVPVTGSDEVDPGLKAISVTFSKKMREGSWSWVQMSKDTFPKMKGKPHYLEDGKTNVLGVSLEPNRTYAIWFNSDTFQNFADEQGRPAVPYLLVFKTGEPREGGSGLDAKAGREDSHIRCLSEGESTVIDITSDFGIDKATVRRKTDEWPKSIIVRLHLTGLESFIVLNGQTGMEWSVSQQKTNRVVMWKDRKEGQMPVNIGNPFRTDVRIGGECERDRYFEVPLPAKLFENNPQEIRLQWVDFHRN